MSESESISRDEFDRGEKDSKCEKAIYALLSKHPNRAFPYDGIEKFLEKNYPDFPKIKFYRGVEMSMALRALERKNKITSKQIGFITHYTVK